MKPYPEYDKLDLPQIHQAILKAWEMEGTFQKSIESRPSDRPFVFYEGPPSANGLPGIHHVLARAIKDLFCRYKSLKGYRVERKAGWDTHGLPVELSVEKELGISKEDIGDSISIEEYNRKCRENVMKYTDVWNELTRQLGFWLNMDAPYVTYHNKYIESVWHLLKDIHDKGLLYKGYTIQPYSPAAGTGLSSHELNQPGCYKEVTDTTVTAQFKLHRNESSEAFFEDPHGDVFLIAWTTTPWTLPSNTALGVGPDIDYVKVKTFNRYTGDPISVLLAEELLDHWFDPKNEELALSDYSFGDKKIPFERSEPFKGKELEGLRYEQLLPYAQPDEGDAFKVIGGDFVTTDEGTGIVHLAPSFGSDDFQIAYEKGIGSLTLVDHKGRFTPEVTDMAGEYVKDEYYENELPEDHESVDVKIAIKLKKANRAFQVAKYQHTYPHCWRTDKPVLYYPLDSWFIKTSEFKDRLIEKNKAINWKPETTGTKRFGNWLENLQDWNLSRSRFWGIPIPIWRTEDREEECCIGSLQELKEACERAVEAGIMDEDPLKGFVPAEMSDENYEQIDLHRPHVDDIVLESPSGKPMYRERDLIDVWFDSGSMPYAQWHYPFENQELFERNYPADFIAEGVDQTRGWFFTLHTIATACFDSIAYRNVVSNGLVLDKHGQKMSKRLGNVIDPFETLKDHSADATRWYMITNAQPWDDLKFDLEGVQEVQRKFFGTLFNTYSFFALYANIDGFRYEEGAIPVNERPELDRWIISRLNSLIEEVDGYYANYEATKAARAIQDFVIEELSNWYVRLSRRKFWKGEYGSEKVAAYQTLYDSLLTVAKLAAPVAPFYTDRLFRDLNEATNREEAESIHLSRIEDPVKEHVDKDLEERMALAKQVASMVLSLRKKKGVRVRQPLRKLIIPVVDDKFERQLRDMEHLVRAEVNVKEIEYLRDTTGVLTKRIKPDYKKLGPRLGKQIKPLAKAVQDLPQERIATLEKEGSIQMELEDGTNLELSLDEVEITTENIPGWIMATEGRVTVALDLQIDEDLREEGIARELVNRVQNLRKEEGFEVTDRIMINMYPHETLQNVISKFGDRIKQETLAEDIFTEGNGQKGEHVELGEGVETYISLQRKEEKRGT
ncbi:MAG: isoleucine--tRNA ligase [Flavobacteriales bacterium]